MSEDKKSHWNFLANLLGADANKGTPKKTEPEKPAPTPPIKGNETPSSGLREPKPTPEGPKRQESAAPKPSPSNWQSIAVQLGLRREESPSPAAVTPVPSSPSRHESTSPGVSSSASLPLSTELPPVLPGFGPRRTSAVASPPSATPEVSSSQRDTPATSSPPSAPSGPSRAEERTSSEPRGGRSQGNSDRRRAATQESTEKPSGTRWARSGSTGRSESTGRTESAARTESARPETRSEPKSTGSGRNPAREVFTSVGEFDADFGSDDDVDLEIGDGDADRDTTEREDGERRPRRRRRRRSRGRGADGGNGGSPQETRRSVENEIESPRRHDRLETVNESHGEPADIADIDESLDLGDTSTEGASYRNRRRRRRSARGGSAANPSSHVSDRHPEPTTSSDEEEDDAITSFSHEPSAPERPRRDRGRRGRGQAESSDSNRPSRPDRTPAAARIDRERIDSDQEFDEAEEVGYDDSGDELIETPQHHTSWETAIGFVVTRNLAHRKPHQGGNSGGGNRRGGGRRSGNGGGGNRHQRKDR